MNSLITKVVNEQYLSLLNFSLLRLTTIQVALISKVIRCVSICIKQTFSQLGFVFHNFIFTTVSVTYNLSIWKIVNTSKLFVSYDRGCIPAIILRRKKEYSSPKYSLPKIQPKMVIYSRLVLKIRYYIVQMLVRRYFIYTVLIATSPATNQCH